MEETGQSSPKKDVILQLDSAQESYRIECKQGSQW
jgi:hypothetical protein